MDQQTTGWKREEIQIVKDISGFFILIISKKIILCRHLPDLQSSCLSHLENYFQFESLGFKSLTQFMMTWGENQIEKQLVTIMIYTCDNYMMVMIYTSDNTDNKHICINYHVRMSNDTEHHLFYEWVTVKNIWKSEQSSTLWEEMDQFTEFWDAP